jgi:Glycosyltransferases involved in cell wall biogenesis
MKLSVIIPTYNGAAILQRSLDTWFQQTMSLTEYEVILVDNNSTDNTHIIAQDYLNKYPNFRYVKEIKPGATSARHTGAKIAKADMLIFADNDGLFNSSCIEDILKVYVQNPAVAAVTGKIEICWDKMAPDWIIPYEFMLGKLDYGNDVKFGYELFLNGGLFSIKKQVFEQLQGFNPDLIGVYLIGDGDTGLVNKLYENHCLIGYTPFAVMQHLQFVESHGTVCDMGRRFFNVGIGNSYALFRKNDFRFSLKVIKYFIGSLIFLIKKWIETNLNRNNRKKYFSYMQKKGELRFFFYLLNKRLRKEIISTEFHL